MSLIYYLTCSGGTLYTYDERKNEEGLTQLLTFTTLCVYIAYMYQENEKQSLLGHNMIFDVFWGRFLKNGPQILKSYNFGDRNILFGILILFDIHKKNIFMTILIFHHFLAIFFKICNKRTILIRHIWILSWASNSTSQRLSFELLLLETHQ